MKLIPFRFYLNRQANEIHGRKPNEQNKQEDVSKITFYIHIDPLHSWDRVVDNKEQDTVDPSEWYDECRPQEEQEEP